jgi:site-specific recombinase XerD
MWCPKTHLPRPALAFLATREGRWCRPVLRHFHRWMSARALVLADLTPAHLEHFWENERQNGLAASTLYARRCRMHKYLFWLAEKGHLRFAVDPPGLRHLRTPLPTLATRFLELPGNRRHSLVVRRFHGWLYHKHIALTELTPAHLEAFLRKPIGVEIGKDSRESLLHSIEPYLLWLHRRGRVRFHVERKIRGPFPVPPKAIGFIDSLRPVLKSTTCDGYVTDLRDFLAWLTFAQIDIDHFDRTAAERWLKSLADRGLGPTTRSSRIFHIRRYLGWLNDKDELAACPDDLLRIEDLPKIPSYLPRPFPIDADRELQRRLLGCGTALGQALFLMRRSGVRIGELVRFEPRCLERDLRGNAFVKVPLGKLDNERLVPLGDDARQVLEALQRQCPTGAEFLILPQLSRAALMTHLSATLKAAAVGLDIPGPVVSHRLRHTYATELLNAGMSLVTIMKLLGHRSFRMTMRYAAIAQQTIVDDYHAAVAQAARKYDTAASSARSLAEAPPERQALDLISCLRKLHGASGNSRHRVEAIIKRLYKLRDDILSLPTSPETA